MTQWKSPSDLTNAQWQILWRLIGPQSPIGRPQTYSWRRVVEAILYVVRTGCAWRMLPHDFPPWKTVYQIFYRWRLSGLWERIHDVLRRKDRQQAGRKPTPSAGVIDSQRVKTTEGGCDRGFNGGGVACSPGFGETVREFKTDRHDLLRCFSKSASKSLFKKF